jgi:manganese/zinc/iron transport system permease protein
MIDFATEEIWIVVTCCVCAAACALPGVFLMLSRSSLLADGISHSALAGIGLAFLITQGRSPIAMLIGALVAGLATVSITSAINRTRIVKRDASLGIVFTTLFAIGVVLVSSVARDIDLDPGCVLYGVAELIPFDTINIAGIELPRAFVTLSVLLLCNLSLCALFWKELKLSIFDPSLASSLGFRPKLVQYALLICVTATIVFSFEALGSILVVSMLVAPAAAAYLLTDSLNRVVVIAVLLGVVSAFLGYLGALAINTSVAGAMSVVAGALFVAAALLGPRHGLLATAKSRYTLRYRIIRDDLLGMLYRWHEVASREKAEPLTISDTIRAIPGRFLVRAALNSLRRAGDVVIGTDNTVRLSEKGLVEARALVRSHRLWEAYLAKHLRLPLDHLHAPSERVEHYIGRALARELADELESKKDPHGRIIP